MSTIAPSSLPVHVIDAILTFAAKSPSSASVSQSDGTPKRPTSANLAQILHVLPPTLLPSTLRSIICTANDVIPEGPSEPAGAGPDLTFLPLVGKTVDSDLLNVFTDILLPVLIPKWRMLTAFAFQLCAAGRLPELQHLDAGLVKLKHLGPLKLPNLFDALLGAVMAGHVDVLTWWHEEAPLLLDLVLPIFCRFASQYGHVQVLDWCVQTGGGSLDSFLDRQEIERCVFHALESEHFQVLDWWVNAIENEMVPVFVLPMPGDAWTRLCKSGNLGALQWLFDHGIEHDEYASPIHDCIDYASEHGHTHILEWWSTRDDFDYTPDSMDKASANGHLGTLEWWQKSGRPLLFTPRGRHAALANRHFGVVQWWDRLPLYAHLVEPAGLNRVVVLDLDLDLNTAAAFGRLDILNDLETDPEVWNIDAVFSASCEFGHLHVLEAYKSQIKAEVVDWSVYRLAAAVAMKQFGALQWCLHNVPSLFFDGSQVQGFWVDQMERAAQEGSLTLLDWVLTHVYKAHVPIYVIRVACVHQQLDVLNFLLHSHGLRDTMDDWDPAAIHLHPLSMAMHRDSVVAWWRHNGLPEPQV